MCILEGGHKVLFSPHLGGAGSINRAFLLTASWSAQLKGSVPSFSTVELSFVPSCNTPLLGRKLLCGEHECRTVTYTPPPTLRALCPINISNSSAQEMCLLFSVYLLNLLFLSLGTHGYLFYILLNNPIHTTVSILLHKSFQRWPLRTPQLASLFLWQSPSWTLCVCDAFLFSSTFRCSRLILHISCPGPRSRLISKEPCYWGTVSNPDVMLPSWLVGSHSF